MRGRSRGGFGEGIPLAKREKHIFSFLLEMVHFEHPSDFLSAGRTLIAFAQSPPRTHANRGGVWEGTLPEKNKFSLEMVRLVPSE